MHKNKKEAELLDEHEMNQKKKSNCKKRLIKFSWKEKQELLTRVV